jgi:predicted NBD/HSP70 family sugar kinase
VSDVWRVVEFVIIFANFVVINKTIYFSEMLNSDIAPIKSKLIRHFIYNGSSTIPDLAKDMELSVPTATKLVAEMCDEGYLNSYGKLKTQGGRRPIVYGLNSDSGYFLGVDIRHRAINVALSNFSGEIVDCDTEIAFDKDGVPDKSVERLCELVNHFMDNSNIDRAKIMSGCLDIPGRVNPASGYSYSHLSFSERPLSEILTDRLGFSMFIENDTRAMTYGEFLHGVVKGESNVLFINLSHGIGMGIIIDGKIYNGKSGFAGEFGHMSVFDNEIMCHCGKKGCLETEISGAALIRQVTAQINDGKSSSLSPIVERGEALTLNDIIEATLAEDLLCIELVEQLGQKLGRNIASIINLLNPELIIIGGTLARVNDYLLPTVRSAVSKYSLNLVHKDSKIVGSKLDSRAGMLGACLIARSRLFD